MCTLLLGASSLTLANEEPSHRELAAEYNDGSDALTVTQQTEENKNGVNKRSLDLQNEAVEGSEVGDLDTAETLVFRPFFRSRYLLNRRRPYYSRRRFYRSVEEPNDDLNTDETLVFRPFFGRRFSYNTRQRFPYYYYY